MSNPLTLLLLVGSIGVYLANGANIIGNDESDVGRRIKEGRRDYGNEFSYVVPIKAVHYDDDPVRCSGTLLSPRAVLTAAECVNSSAYVEVTINGYRINFWSSEIYYLTPDSVASRGFYQGNNIITTPQPATTQSFSDIALLRLQRRRSPLPGLSSVVNYPVIAFEELNGNGIVAGWGDTIGDSTNRVNSGLNYAPVQILGSDQCKAQTMGYSTIIKNAVNSGRVLCSEGENDASINRQYKVAGICNGDEGGPLLSKDTGTLYLVGIHSMLDSTSCADKLHNEEHKIMFHYALHNYRRTIRQLVKYIAG